MGQGEEIWQRRENREVKVFLITWVPQWHASKQTHMNSILLHKTKFTLLREKVLRGNTSHNHCNAKWVNAIAGQLHVGGPVGAKPIPTDRRSS